MNTHNWRRILGMRVLLPLLGEFVISRCKWIYSHVWGRLNLSKKGSNFIQKIGICERDEKVTYK